jgi:hypothetical protein
MQVITGQRSAAGSPSRPTRLMLRRTQWRSCSHLGLVVLCHRRSSTCCSMGGKGLARRWRHWPNPQTRWMRCFTSRMELPIATADNDQICVWRGDACLTSGARCRRHPLPRDD